MFRIQIIRQPLKSFISPKRFYISPHKPLDSQKGIPFGAGKEMPDHISKDEDWKSKHALENEEFDAPQLDTTRLDYQPNISEEDPTKEGIDRDVTDDDVLESVIGSLKQKK